MDKRKNLRNPDLLAYDYVSVLIQWDDAPSFIFRVAKVLGSSFPFNAEMISITGSDSNLTVDFRFGSSFDINTSPWQFELEVGITAASVKFKPSAMYNASNNRIKVRFTLGTNLIPPNSYLVFTAKRYRPSTQYLAELAAASVTAVTIEGGGGDTEISSPTINSGDSGNTNTLGVKFTAPTTFTITKIAVPLFFQQPIYPLWNVKIVKLNAPLPTSNFNILHEQYFIPNTVNSSINTSIIVNSGETIVCFLAFETSSGGSLLNPSIYQINTYNTSILGFPVTFTSVVGIGIIDSISSIDGTLPSNGTSVRLFYGGAATWSNIVY